MTDPEAKQDAPSGRGAILLWTVVAVAAALVLWAALGRRTGRFYLCTWITAMLYLLLAGRDRLRRGRWSGTGKVLAAAGWLLLAWLGAESAIRTVRRVRNARNIERHRVVDAFCSELARLCRSGLHSAGDLTPGFRGRCGQSEVTINEHGTRGRSFPVHKPPGEQRVICIGGSTTFGATFKSGDRLFPDVLEDILRRKLKRPVTVINGGVSAYKAADSVKRFEAKLMALDPDVVVVYHGINDVLQGLRDTQRFAPCASLLLRWLRGHVADALGKTPVAQHDPGPYVDAYRQLLDLCASRGIAVCLVSFALAFDETAPPEDMRYYASVLPLYPGQTPAKALRWVRHRNAILAELARQRHVVFVDAAAELMGRQDLFLDFAHFHQPGRHRLAEMVAEGILPLLERRRAPHSAPSDKTRVGATLPREPGRPPRTRSWTDGTR